MGMMQQNIFNPPKDVKHNISQIMDANEMPDEEAEIISMKYPNKKA